MRAVLAIGSSCGRGRGARVHCLCTVCVGSCRYFVVGAGEADVSCQGLRVGAVSQVSQSQIQMPEISDSDQTFVSVCSVQRVRV